ncbi:helix-turn-helix transcriptional regulator [Pseudonocardia humida]|uniref:WYL domain-containing protein n=1 Tax=Pseudonocardia humida TaxID=2800819 RepID=A0ABT0ZZ97_9PSEU|nr:WYL domain-containing protein [Pseudonocardia humida]MCO1656079.1 WYL domain-containing protein [Pseudonocardia humida]
MSASGVTERLPRLLSLVPYLQARPGIPVAEAAADFGITERQLRRDLELLWMCGLPGYGPGDLIDLSFSGDTVSVISDAGMGRPLRLTTAEATALLVALRTLAEMPGVVDTAAVRRATAKIERAVGDAGPGQVAVEVTREEEAATAAVRDALTSGRAMHIVYYTAGRDSVSQRTIDPMRLLIVDGRGYLEAWCRRAEGVRLFRLDRVEDVVVLDEPASPPPDAEPTDVSGGLFRPTAEHRSAVLLLEPRARWVAEYYPVDEVVEAEGERLRVRLRYADPTWLVRLVLGLGGGARLLEPRDLAARVGARAREALAAADPSADDPAAPDAGGNATGRIDGGVADGG